MSAREPTLADIPCFRVRYDPEVGATYIKLEGYDDNHARTTTPGADEGVMLDFNAEGFVTGIELAGFRPSWSAVSDVRPDLPSSERVYEVVWPWQRLWRAIRREKPRYE